MVDFTKRMEQALNHEDDELLSSLVHGGEEDTDKHFYPPNFFMEQEQTSVTPYSEEDAKQGEIISLALKRELPECYHRAMELGTRTDCQLSLQGISDRDKLDILSIYEGSEPRSFTKYLNKTVTLIGCAIMYHPDFEAFDKSGPKPGYEYIVYLTDDYDENGLPITIRGSAALTNFTRGMLQTYGWFIWDEPVRYTLRREENGPFKLINQDRVDKMLAAKKARQEKK